MSRLVSRGPSVRNGIGIVAALAITVIGGFEGRSLVAYKDVIGVWTACDGETRGIRPGMRFTNEQCDKMFMARLDEFGDGMEKCVPSLKDEAATPPTRYVAHLSLAYNIGLGAYCKSSIARLQNAGDVRASCNAFMLYNKAGGVVWKGLTTRRTKERDFCLKGA